MLTSFIFPLIATVFGLIIEYWIIHPLKYRQDNPPPVGTLESDFPISIIAKYIALFTVLIAFLLSIFFIVERLHSNLNYSLATKNLFFSSFLSDANISLASIIYTSVALIFFVWRNYNLIRRGGVFSVFVLPSILFLLWASAFVSKALIIFCACLFLSNYWLAGGLLWTIVKFSKEDIYLIVLLSLFLFPTNALILVFIAMVPSFSAWTLAFFILVTQLYVVIKVDG